jgi:integrase
VPGTSGQGSLNRAVKVINQEVLRHTFATSAKDRYFLREKGGRDSIQGLHLRVGARVVWFGHRKGGPFVPVAQARQDMSPDEIDECRRQVRAKLAEAMGPQALRGRTMTVSQLGELYLKDLEATRGSRRSELTLAGYAELWENHLVPLIGTRKLEQVTPDTVREVKMAIPQRVKARFPNASYRGQTVANRAAQQADAAWNFALRMEWVSRNPWSGRIVRRYEEEPDEHLLTAEDYAALGRALREAEAALGRPRPPLPMRSIAAIRVLLVTGARPGEITPAVISPEFRMGPDGSELHFCDLDARFPTLRVPRAKGDRGAIKRPLGRLIFLPSVAVETIREVPRSDGSIHAFPGDLPGEPIRRLEKAWGHLLDAAGLPHVPLKTTRPSWRTHAADCDIPPEHVQLLMGHAGLKITDTVYLKRIAPSLSASAQKVGAYIWSLLNPHEAGQAQWQGDGDVLEAASVRESGSRV